MTKEIVVDEFHKGMHAEAYRDQVQRLRIKILEAQQHGQQRSQDRANACDFLRATVLNEDGHTIPLSNQHAEQIIGRVSEALGMSEAELAGKLAGTGRRIPASECRGK